MNKWFYIIVLSFFLGNFSGFSQEELTLVATDTVSAKINPLAPAKAAFYSAILPGLGQAYNKKYWKIPIVYAALGTGIYAYAWNKKKYNSFRDAYKERLLLGENSHDQYPFLSDQKLIDAQKFHQRNKDLSLLITVGLYVLNIVDANVSAHLQQFNVNGKLTVRPEIHQNEINYKHNVGLAFNYQF